MPAEAVFLDTNGWIAHDKTWGLVDCASFIVMRESGIGAAFTNDGHFKQAGFRCLLSAA